jgi:hypothetical protein
MTPAAKPELVARAERLARFIFQKRHLRADMTPRPEAFLPDRQQELSMTRHLQLHGDELWEIGHAIGAVCDRILRGRADVTAAAFLQQKLRVVAAPTTDNPNHANAIDWPPEKPLQKAIAQEIAAAAGKALPAPVALICYARARRIQDRPSTNSKICAGDRLEICSTRAS